jgi:predicted Rossmann fold flavoprotein
MEGAVPAQRRRVLVIGGGAAGFFAAIACAEADPAAEVSLHEATAHLLAKVRVSGGGRCNVTHACFEPRELARNYPRGERELIGPLSRFGPADTVAWFRARGVELKAEADGRMFPVTDTSSTIVGCLAAAARCAGVRVVTGSALRALAVAPGPRRFRATLSSGEQEADRVLLATGGGKASAGLAIAAALGHAVEPPVPSLFTFHVDDPRLKGLEGLACPGSAAAVPAIRRRAVGPILITHWGLSGPGILRLSAWGARGLHALGYHFGLEVNWAEPRSTEQATADLQAERRDHPRRQVATANPWGIPARLWERLAAAAGLGTAAWAGVGNDRLRDLALQATAGAFTVAGKSMNKEEFVTCGGVRLAEVNMATMESRLCPGLYFAGEILDIDGITGGFNFQAAWTTGWQAGRALAAPGVVSGPPGAPGPV